MPQENGHKLNRHSARSAHSRASSNNYENSTDRIRRNQEIKERGYYSELATVDPDSTFEIARQAPAAHDDVLRETFRMSNTARASIFDLQGIDIAQILANSKEGEFTTEFKRSEVYLEKTFEPKVFMPFYTAPYTLPRKVEIERRKRLYLSLDLPTLLEERNIDTNKLMPKYVPADKPVTLNMPNEDPAPFDPFLPLYYFDDTDFEIWTPETWLALGHDPFTALNKPLPGIALLPDKPQSEIKDIKDSHLNFHWHNVSIHEYDAEKQLWLVTPDNREHEVFDMYRPAKQSRKQMEAIEGEQPATPHSATNGHNHEHPSGTHGRYWIPRIQLHFLAEDPRIFADRVTKAYLDRKRTEAELRSTLFIDCMPTDGIGKLDDERIKRMIELTKTGAISKTVKDELVTPIVEEVNLDYARTMNTMVFEEVTQSDPISFAFITLPIKQRRLVPPSGCIGIPEYSFNDVFDRFKFISLLTSKSAIDALKLVRTECDYVINNLSLLQKNFPKHVKLDEFESMQVNQTSTTHMYLTDTWKNNLRQGIKTQFIDVGRGWYNINESDFHIYKVSKLKKFIERVKFMMQDTLRFLVQESCQNYVRMITDACTPILHLKEDFKWPKDDLANSPYKPPKNPLFHLDLTIDQVGPRYVTSYENFPNIILGAFDRAILQTQAIPQIEKDVMENIFWGGEMLRLESVALQEKKVIEWRETLQKAVHASLIPLKAYAEAYEIYVPLMNLNIDHYTKDFEKTEKSIEEYRNEILIHVNEKDKLEKSIPTSIVIGPYFVFAQKLREALSNKRKALIEALLLSQTKRARSKTEELNDTFRDIQRKLYEKPNSAEDLSEHREWMKSVPEQVDDKKDDIQKILEEFTVLDEFFYNLSNEDFQLKYGLLSWPWKLRTMLEAVEEQHKEDEDRFKKLQVQDTATLNDKMDQLIMSVAGLSGHMSMDRAHEVANECRKLNKALKECVEASQTYNNRERLLGLPVTNYDKLSRLVKDFEPYRVLWSTTSDWLRSYDSWMNDPIISVNAEDIEKNVTEMYKNTHKSIKTFADNEARFIILAQIYDPDISDLRGIQQIAVAIKGQIEDFKPSIPLIQALRAPGMRNRHWEELSELVKMAVRPKKELTFAKCLEMGLQKHIEVITKVAEKAAKEFSIEQQLDKMEQEWKPIRFEVLPYKQTGTYIIKASEDISQMLDDHIVATQSMSFSPFKKAFEERIASWENKLKITQEVLDEWLACQRSWLYLEPIFSSEDIIRQLPVESKRYQTMERIWRKVMKQAKENPEVISLCPEARLRDNLREANKLLEQVQKGLSEYLETKRMAFPRFYFLSDDELLQILSQTKDPKAVQPHLRKCFENITKVKFEDDMRISKMYSAEQEEVAFRKDIYPIGNVEDWMCEIEKVMRETLRQVIRDALQDYVTRPRKQWVQLWPGQIVVAGSQTFWTTQVSEALEKKEIVKYHKQQLHELDELRELVRGELTDNARETLKALIVIEVHARDVVINLIDEKVMNVNDFEWISQLRYYWNEDHLYIRAVNAEFRYGYEYLGNTPRLVITPLTDRCYLTLTGALHLKFGGAPAGPAGTGKTETTKDLAKAMAVQCVVFNCSDQLDFMAMAKFFCGLASAGAWACFDEFNRIDIEVLSVVAQQIQVINQALMQKRIDIEVLSVIANQVLTIQLALRTHAERFMFEGKEIVLKSSCAVFITMNPGYAGRTELPDNLKALFRPVAMMVPDYGLIAENSLFSFGFSEAKPLAKKIVQTFKLSSEQLSSQDHYDFGMRAVKSVISAAGNLKRQYSTMNEDLICLRAIRDVNIPKFLQDDLKLFTGIVSDLFPKIKEEPIDYKILEEGLRHACKQLNIKDVPGFLLKCIQLFETTIVRHGLMLVGPTGSGKTKSYESLKIAMTYMKGKINPAGTPFKPVYTYILNPKSITMGQLYGAFDDLTHEWTDGILSTLMREGVAAENDDKRWYLFDGPVDAVWIENMNTVLDDNKKLCLSSGEIIKMTEAMTMMFEVADLSQASPATVSRCGMVYLEPSILGLQPFVECWVKKLPDPIFKHYEAINQLFNNYLEPSLKFIRKNVKEIIPTYDSNLTFSLIKMFDCFIQPFRPRESDKPAAPEAAERVGDLIEPWFIFSLIWSVGASCDNDSRRKFSEWLRQKLEHDPIKLAIPAAGLVYDYVFDDGGIVTPSEEQKANEEEGGDDSKKRQPRWKHWLADLPPFQISHDAKFSDILVPTIDNIRNAHVIEMLLRMDRPVLCVGPTGTSKTLTVADKLMRSMPKEFSPEFIVFSAKTNANQTQDLIDSKLDKRRRGIYGPPLGKVFLFFIDDLNMPALETYGAQPPIELIRQFMDFKGWYDRKVVGEFRTLVDINFIGAMGPPGGGRNPVTPRLTRHFNFISFTELENDSMKKIFSTIFNWWTRQNEFVLNLSDKLIMSSIEVYKTICASLLPTPSKSHYTFNLRDLSKVFQGMLMMEAKRIDNVEGLLRLWYHENCRVFQDRLINDEDRDWFRKLLGDRMKADFNMNFESVVQEPVLYGDFVASSADKSYQEIDDVKLMKKRLDEYLEEYNQVNTTKMNLVLFLDAMKHLSRIIRVIKQPLGNSLLLGVGGSGRQSLTRLAAFISEYELRSIQLSKSYGMSEWKEDLRKFMLHAGLRNTPTVFLFSDTQIKSESFLEDLNNILNSGDVPNIYAIDELEQIYTLMKPVVSEAGLPPTKTNLYSAYTKRVRQNLHTVVCMSPIGEVFRARLRQFPALVNCCTIDWYSEWPKDALEAVSETYLNNMITLDADAKVVQGLVKLCQEIHQSAAVMTIKYRDEMSRHNYVTPTSYLELLNIFSKIFGKKKDELVFAKKRTKTGLDKLLSTEKDVAKLRVELNEMLPLLDQAVQETNETMAKIAEDTASTEVIKTKVAAEEEEVQVKVRETRAIASEASERLAEALPALEAALQSLEVLSKNDINEVRALQRPPQGVKLTMEAVSILKQVEPNKVTVPGKNKKEDDYWEPGRALLADAGKFLQSLRDFDKENIPEIVIQKLQKHIDSPDFDPIKIEKTSKACKSLCMWCRAMYSFYMINKEVAPRKEALANAEAELAVVKEVLATKKRELKRLEEGLRTLQVKYEDAVRKKTDYETKVEECNQRIVRAERLTTGLGDEKIRWQENVLMLDHALVNVIGDVLVCSGFIAYLGPFTAEYRDNMVKEWITKLKAYNVPHSDNPELVRVLGDAVKIRSWQLAGLPKDNLSVQNGVIVQYSNRWPLFIDPQGQANKWIKNMEKNTGLDVMKLSDRDYLRTLENSIRFGKPCLLENVGTEIDPALEPVLLRQTFRQSGSTVIKLGDAVIPYHDDFRFYITTKLPNPHYTPEISVKVTLVNFTLSPSGLEDQMLARVVAEERPDLEEMKNTLIISNATMRNELKALEDTILEKLSTSENPVDDIELINALEASKAKSTEIKTKMQAAEQTEKDIDLTRAEYVPVAVNTQILFFCVSDLANVDPMYQYSLEWFTNIFLSSIQSAPRADNLEQRIKNINEFFTFSLYCNVCRSLFEKHKLLFAFLLTVRVLMHQKKVHLVSYNYFI
ncbi:unnamed protein product [Adineta steineri]|uniref:Uncharacterized protein n=1 Tax=Adineta steineri TaxID=433720 RepID=A0A814SMB7_9BILA|nr:unnamed protein product [Adineta steineri]